MSADLEKPNAEPGSVDASLLNLMRQHHSVSSSGWRNPLSFGLWIPFAVLEKVKKDAIKSAAAVSDLLVDAVNGGVQVAFINEKRIELEIRSLTATVGRFMKQTDQWLAASHAIKTAIKEIGDFENWMKVMDYDCRSINAAIRNIHQC